MEKSKSSILFMCLTVVGLIIWAVCFFFGFNYTNNGAWMASMSLALFLLVVTAVLVYLMVKHSKANDASSSNTKIIIIVLYCLSVVASAIYVVHFLDITLNHQNEIQDEALAEIKEIVDYIDCDEENPNPQSYMYWVNQELDSYRRHLRAQDVSESTIETRVAELKAQLVDESGFSELVNEADGFLPRCNYSVENWVWLTVPKYLGQLSEKKPQYEERLEHFAMSTDFTREDSNPYKCTSSHNDTSMVERVSSVSIKSWTFIPIILVLVLQLMILLIYFRESGTSSNGPKRDKGGWATSYDPTKIKSSSEPSNNFSTDHLKGHRNQGNPQDNNYNDNSSSNNSSSNSGVSLT